jgi:ribosomal protein L6P/L9E
MKLTKKKKKKIMIENSREYIPAMLTGVMLGYHLQMQK